MFFSQNVDNFTGVSAPNSSSLNLHCCFIWWLWLLLIWFDFIYVFGDSGIWKHVFLILLRFVSLTFFLFSSFTHVDNWLLSTGHAYKVCLHPLPDCLLVDRQFFLPFLLWLASGGFCLSNMKRRTANMAYLRPFNLVVLYLCWYGALTLLSSLVEIMIRQRQVARIHLRKKPTYVWGTVFEVAIVANLHYIIDELQVSLYLLDSLLVFWLEGDWKFQNLVCVVFCILLRNYKRWHCAIVVKISLFDGRVQIWCL